MPPVLEGRGTVRPSKDTACYHCGEAVAGEPTVAADIEHPFCCGGCLGAYRIIHDSGYDDYYTFRDEFGSRPDGDYADELTAWAAQLVPDGRGLVRGSFVVEGMHCASCVWLSEKILSALPGVVECRVQLASGRARLTWEPGAVGPRELASACARVGYRLRPMDLTEGEAGQQEARSLLIKAVTAGFFAGNSMLLSFALYAGYFGFMDRYTRNFFHLVAFALTVPVLVFSARVFYVNALRGLRHGVPGMDLLVSLGITLAFGYSTYAAFAEAGEVFFDSVSFIVFVLLIGRYIEQRLRARSLFQIENLVSALPRTVEVISDSGERSARPLESLNIGERIFVRRGQVVPVDGKLLGEALAPEEQSVAVDESVMTGESRPVVRRVGEIVISGSRSLAQDLTLRIVSLPQDSAAQRIRQMSEESLMSVPRSVRLSDLASRWFVLFVLAGGAAAVAFHMAVLGAEVARSIVVLVSFLIAACPCALSLAIPTAYTVALKRAFAEGVLMKDGRALEALAACAHVAFDKTGTLTEGRLTVAVESHQPGVPPARLLNLAAAMEFAADVRHPVARAITAAATNPKEMQCSAGTYEPGNGVEASALALLRSDLPPGSTIYRLGRPDWAYPNRTLPVQDAKNQIVSVLTRKTAAGDFDLLALFFLGDRLRPEAGEVVQSLRARGIATCLLSGDRPENVAGIAREIGLPDARGGLSPSAKLGCIRELGADGQVVAMVGDGINDSVALAAADVGISFAASSEIAANSADVLLMGGDLRRLDFLFRLSRRVRRKMIQNLCLAFGYNVILLPLAFLGLVIPIVAAILMAVSSVTVTVNSLLLLRSR